MRLSRIHDGRRFASDTTIPPPASTIGLGIESLLAIAVRQRHIYRRQADDGQLGAGHRTSAAEHEIGCGVSKIHAIDVGHQQVRRLAVDRLGSSGFNVADLSRPGDMQDLDAGREQVADRADHGTVERACSL